MTPQDGDAGDVGEAGALVMSRDDVPKDAALVCIDRDGTITQFNKVAEKLFGRTEDYCVGKNVTILMPSPYKENHHKFISAFLRTGNSKLIGKKRQLTAQHKDGSTFQVEALLQVEQDDNGKVTGFYGVLWHVRAAGQGDRSTEDIVTDAEGLVDDGHDAYARAHRNQTNQSDLTTVERVRGMLFNVLFVLLKKSDTKPVWITILKMVIDFVQLAAFLFYSQADFPWNDSYIGWMKSLVGAFLFLPISASINMWAVVFSVVCLELMVACYVGYAITNNQMHYPSLMVFLKNTGSILVETLYMPIVTLFSVRMRRGGDGPVEATAAILSGIVGPFFIAFALVLKAVSSTGSPRAGADVPGQAHSRISLFLLAVRTTMSLVFGFLAGTTSVWFLAAVALCSYVASAAAVTLYLPFFNMFYSRVQACFLWVLAWGAMCLIVALLQDDPTDSGPALALYMGTPLVIAATLHAIEARVRWLTEAPTWKLRGALEVELKTRFMLLQHFGNDSEHELVARRMHEALHRSSSVGRLSRAAAEDEQKELVFQEVTAVYEEASEMWPKEAILCIFRASYYLYYTQNKHKVWRMLRLAESKASLMDEQYMIFFLRHTIGNMFDGEDIVGYLMHKQRLQDARRGDELSSVSLLMFWSELLKPEPDVANLSRFTEDLGRYVSMTNTQYETLLRATKMVTPSMLRMYSGFLDNIINDSTRAQQMINRADHLEALNQQATRGGTRGVAASDDNKAWSEDSPIVTVGGEADTLGEVVRVNQSVVSFMGFQEAELVGRDFSVMLSPPYAADIQENLQHYHTNGNDKLLKPVSVLGYVKEGYVVPFTLYMKEFSPDNRTLEYMVALHMRSTDDNFVVLDEDRNVQSFTAGCNMILGSSISRVQMMAVPIKSWMSGYTDDVHRRICAGETVGLEHTSPATDSRYQLHLKASSGNASSEWLVIQIAAETKARETTDRKDAHMAHDHLTRELKPGMAASSESKSTSLAGSISGYGSDAHSLVVEEKGPPSTENGFTPIHALAGEEEAAGIKPQPRTSMRKLSTEASTSVLPGEVNPTTNPITSNITPSSMVLENQPASTAISRLIAASPSSSSAHGMQQRGKPVALSLTIESLHAHDTAIAMAPPEIVESPVELEKEDSNPVGHASSGQRRKGLGPAQSTITSKRRVQVSMVSDSLGRSMAHRNSNSLVTPEPKSPSHKKDHKRRDSALDDARSETSGVSGVSSNTSSGSSKSTRLRNKVLAAHKVDSEQLSRFKYAMVLSISLVVAASVSMYVMVEVTTHMFMERANLLVESSERQYLAVRMAQETATLVRLQQGTEPAGAAGAGLNATRAKLVAATNRLEEIDYHFRSVRSQESGAIRHDWDTPSVPVYESSSDLTSTRLVSLWEAVRALVLRSHAVSSDPLSQLTTSNEDVFYILQNAPFVIGDMYNQSTFRYVAKADEELNLVATVSLYGTIGCVGLLVIVLALVVMPSVLRVQTRQRQMLMLFVALPPHIIKDLWLQSRVRIRRLYNETDELFDEAVADSIEADRKAYKLRKNTAANAKKKVAAARKVQVTKVDRSHLKITSFFMCLALYFVMVYLAGVGRVIPLVDHAARTLVWVGTRRNSMELTQYTMMSSVAANVEGVPSSTLYNLTQRLWLERQLFHHLEFGYGEDIQAVSGRHLGDSYDHLLLRDACPEWVGSPNLSPQADCSTWRQGVMMNGLYPVVNDYIRLCEEIQAKLAANPPTNASAVRVMYALEAVEMTRLLVEHYMPPALAYEVFIHQDYVSQITAELDLTETLLFVAFFLMTFVMYFVLYRPVVTQLDRQSKQMQSMILMMPSEVLVEMEHATKAMSL